MKLWQGLHGGGQALEHLHTLKVGRTDDFYWFCYEFMFCGEVCDPV